MAKTVVLDGVMVKRLAVVARGQSGQIEISCEYDVTAGGRAVQSKFVTLDAQQGAAWQAALTGVIGGIGQQVSAAELG